MLIVFAFSAPPNVIYYSVMVLLIGLCVIDFAAWKWPQTQQKVSTSRRHQLSLRVVVLLLARTSLIRFFQLLNQLWKNFHYSSRWMLIKKVSCLFNLHPWNGRLWDVCIKVVSLSAAFLNIRGWIFIVFGAKGVCRGAGDSWLKVVNVTVKIVQNTVTCSSCLRRGLYMSGDTTML